MGPSYRRRATWTSAISGYIIVIELEALLADIGAVPFAPPYSASLSSAAFYFLLFGVGLLVIWVWIDSAIKVALDLDYFHRDILSW